MDVGFGDEHADGDGGEGRLRWLFGRDAGTKKNMTFLKLIEPIVESARELLKSKVKEKYHSRLDGLEPQSSFVNVYEVGKEHGTKKHEDTEPVFGTATVLLTQSDSPDHEDSEHGLRLLFSRWKEGKEELDALEAVLCLKQYEVVVFAPRVRHWVPCEARGKLRSTLNLFF